MMWRERNPDKDAMANEPCSDWRPRLILFAAGDELDVVEQSELAAHLADCSECRSTLESEKELIAMLGEHRVEPDAVLLASCRASLEDALDREEEGGWLRRKIGALLPAGWMSPRPAWSGALLVMIGFSVGMFGPRLLRHPVISAPSAHMAAAGSVADSAADSSVLEPVVASPPSSKVFDVHTADVAGINVLPAAGNDPPQVELQMRSEQPVTVRGTVDDGTVKNALLYVLRNNQRFGPDVRLNAVDLLSTRSGDPEVRSTLNRVVETDRDPAVRLKALDALNGSARQDMVRNTLLGALEDDQDSDVRVEAIDSLRRLLESGQIASDDGVLAVLRDRMGHDSNPYIRLQSAAVIRDLDSR
jgi:hypothetical protein